MHKCFAFFYLVFGIILVKFIEGAPGNANKCSSEKAKLKAVSMLFRHGDRSPSGSYPLDPYKDYPWPGGEGALSTKGAHELYQSGLLKSVRYSSLLSLECPVNDVCTYDFDRMVVQSSAVQRCVDSVNNFLDGFLRVEWPSDLVNVLPNDEDEMLGYPGKLCPKYAFNMSIPISHSAFKKIINFNSPKGQNLLDYLRNNSGLAFEDAMDILGLEDTWLIQKIYGFVLPAWVDTVWEQYIHPLSNVLFELMAELMWAQIRIGSVLKDMITRIQNFKEGSIDQNILIYSAHDINVAAMLNVLGIVKQTVSRPSYGSSVNFEFYENQDIRNDLEIRVLYFMNHADTNPIQAKIAGCPAPCPFAKFVQKVRSKLTYSYEARCEI